MEVSFSVVVLLVLLAAPSLAGVAWAARRLVRRHGQGIFSPCVASIGQRAAEVLGGVRFSRLERRDAEWCKAMAEYLIDALEARKDYTQCVIVPFLVRRYVKNLLTAPFDMLRKRIELLGSTSPEANIKRCAVVSLELTRLTRVSPSGDVLSPSQRGKPLVSREQVARPVRARRPRRVVQRRRRPRSASALPNLRCRPHSSERGGACRTCCASARARSLSLLSALSQRCLCVHQAYGTTTTWWRRADGEWWCATCYYEKLILSSHEGLNMDGMMSMTVEGDKGPRTVPEQDYTEAELDFGPEDMNMGGPHYHLTLPPPARPSTSPVLPRPPPGPKTERPPPVPKTERLSARRPKAATKK